MLRKLTLAAFVVAALSAVALGVGINRDVPSQRYPTIQSAINACQNGDVVRVDDGTYQENIDFLGKEIRVRSLNGAAACIIDGGGSLPCVTFENGEGNGSILNGFTLTNGGAKLWDFYGVYEDREYEFYCGNAVYSLEASPTIKNCIIHGHDSTGYGYDGFASGIAILSAPYSYTNATIDGCEIYDCHAARYGAALLVWCAGEGTVIEHNYFHDNDEGEWACPSVNITLSEPGFGIRYNTFEEPDAWAALSHLSVQYEGDETYIESNIFTNCEWGLDLTAYGEYNITNNTFYGGGCPIHVAPYWLYCAVVLFNNTITDSYFPIYLNGEGAPIYFNYGHNNIDCGILKLYYVYVNNLGNNINIDPGLVDPDNGDFHLASDSGLIDIGTNAAWGGLSDEDFEGDDRIIDGTVDIGADETDY